MEILLIILLLLTLILVTNIIGHYITIIPTALIQIIAGVLVALVMNGFTIEVESEWFLLLFIAPLLYNDSAHYPREELWRMRLSILGNAILLVLLTTVIGGYFVHWLIPAIPLAAAFALAAILSPTDPVAVNGIAKRVHIPERIMNLVRGESLINDASGLVGFSYAVAAVVTGYFSIGDAAGNFLYMFIIGAVVGTALSIMMIWIRFKLRRTGIEDVVFYSLLQILTPFIIFFVAEELLHASGVIAVVAGGIIYSLNKDRTENLIAQEQILTDNIWSIIAYVLNGTIFLLLGLTLPDATRSLFENEAISNWLLFGYIGAIGLVVLGIRWIWTALFNRIDYYVFKSKDALKPTFRQDLITTLVGVRGTITMVGVLSLPFLTNLGEAFPERGLIIFLAAGVICFTLIAATLLLPVLSQEGSSHQPQLNINKHKQRMLLRAIQKIRSETTEQNAQAAYDLLSEYNAMLHMIQVKDKDSNELKAYNEEVTQARLQAIKLEREFTHAYIEMHQVPPLVAKEVKHSLVHREKSIQSSTTVRIYNILTDILYIRKRDQLPPEQLQLITQFEHKLHSTVYAQMIEHLKEKGLGCSPEVTQKIIHLYKRMQLKNEAMNSSMKQTDLEEHREILCLRAIEEQRKEISAMFNEDIISIEEAKELRRFVNYIEGVVLYEHVE